MLPLLLALLSPPVSPPAPDLARQELSFGVDVARKGLWREARFRFERAAALDPGNPQAQNDLAVALEQEGAFDKAREAYETALRLKPGDVSIQQNFDLFREADEKRNRKKRRK